MRLLRFRVVGRAAHRPPQRSVRFRVPDVLGPRCHCCLCDFTCMRARCTRTPHAHGARAARPARMHARARTGKQTTCTRARACTRARTGKRTTCTTHTRTRFYHARTRTRTPTHTHTRAHACTHTHTHTRITRTRTRTHARTRTRTQCSAQVSPNRLLSHPPTPHPPCPALPPETGPRETRAVIRAPLARAWAGGLGRARDAHMPRGLGCGVLGSCRPGILKSPIPMAGGR